MGAMDLGFEDKDGRKLPWYVNVAAVNKVLASVYSAVDTGLGAVFAKDEHTGIDLSPIIDKATG